MMTLISTKNSCIDRSERTARAVMVSEIYPSIQGEGSHVGMPCTFIRLMGCDLRCVYCDSKYTWDGSSEGIMKDISQIVTEVESLGCKVVEITGGEPLLQSSVLPLMAELCERGRTVLLETGGHIDATSVDQRVIRIIDVKTPGSGMLKRGACVNLDKVRASDEFKFVILDEGDYLWAISVIKEHGLSERAATVWLSPVHEQLMASRLAEWVLRDGMEVRVQLQLHKFIWPEDMRKV